MGLRWRKTIRKGPVNVSLSRGGVGWSVGVPGIRLGIGADGKPYFSVGIPGTGLSYLKKMGRGKAEGGSRKPEE